MNEDLLILIIGLQLFWLPKWFAYNVLAPLYYFKEMQKKHNQHKAGYTVNGKFISYEDIYKKALK